MKEEVERIKKLVGVDHNRWEQPCTCDICKNMCEVPCIGTPKDIEAIIDAGYADRLKETMWMVGYDSVTTFWDDFSIADKYGIAGVKDTYKRAFSEWKDDYKFFTELTLVLNHKIWQHYDSNRELAALYDRLWREADEYAMNNFKGEELDYYYRITD